MHLEATTKIYFTREYNRFKKIQGNRNLNLKKIDKIIADIQQGFNMLEYCPIIVDKEMNVIDGQHRLQVAMKIESNIWYVIADSKKLIEIAKLNTNTERWKPKDFINCYCEVGINDYKVLRDFLVKYKFPISLTLSLLESGKYVEGGVSDSATTRFENGQFKCKNLKNAEKLADLVHQYKDFTGFLRRNFIIALGMLIDGGKCDMKKLHTKFLKNQTPLFKCISVKGFMNGFEQIYNQNAQKREVIF